MTRRFKRWLSILVLGMLAFSQASLVLAACAMDRGEMGRMLAAEQGSDDCCGQAMPLPGGDPLPMSANGCVAHCTSDLQVFGQPGTHVLASTEAQVLVLPYRDLRRVATPAEFRGPLPSVVPLRILLHSFLI